jgi:ArsR family transcriptional regulator
MEAYAEALMIVNVFARMGGMQFALPVRERGICCDVALDIKPAAVNAAVDLLRLLADPARLQMMASLQDADQPVCVCDFTAALGLSQPTISHHMGKLRNAGLVKVTRLGIWSFYEIAPGLPPAVRDLLSSAVAAGEATAVSTR